MNRHTYHDPQPIIKSDAETIFASNNTEKICETMVSVAFFEQDWKWVQEKFLAFLDNKDPQISGLAATCLGHIARIQGKIDKTVIEELKRHLSNKQISGRVEDALSDIQMFVK